MIEPLRIAICEDRKEDSSLLLRCIRQSRILVRCDVFRSGKAFYQNFKAGRYHLIFLDIYMPDINGIDAAARIREADNYVMLAFTTMSPAHALEVQRFRSLLYIQKPVTPEMVTHTLTLARAMHECSKKDILTITGKHRHLFDIRRNDIRYVEFRNKRCIFFLTDDNQIESVTTLTLDRLEMLLPKPQFYRTHRSFIVNLRYVDYPTPNDFMMKGGGIVYISQKEHSRVIQAYDDYLFTLARKDHQL